MTFAGSDHIDHVRTRMYYAGTVFCVTTAVFLLHGFTSITPLVLLPVGQGVLCSLVYVFSEGDTAQKHPVKPGTTQLPLRKTAEDD
ncbi:hypothetical protein MW046_14545 (plasmid) [Halocatena salina]|uniref:Uncharacterized protein n=1 Tax=Halocatena salina TaxID=2934340 RepID=A0A8U0A4V0_9EURY|nr:hypothetical protein MW046_14545 [Halocatena salina]